MNVDKKLILLDLDNTLICAEDLDTCNPSSLEKAKKNLHCIRMEDYYDIFERPHLQDFLSFIFQNFKVGIWTASSKAYAIFIVKNFILKEGMKRNLEIFLCSYHCNVSKRKFKISKDLNFIENKNVILIDDLEELSTHQPDKVIQVKPFFFDEESASSDQELLKVKDILKTRYL
jgi:TFIIF-interacting CTD phosphatase-like protein